MIKNSEYHHEWNFYSLMKLIRNHAFIFPEFILKQTPYYNQKYLETYRRSLEEPEEFWSEIGQCVSWTKRWDKVLDNSEAPFTKWWVLLLLLLLLFIIIIIYLFIYLFIYIQNSNFYTSFYA